MANIVISNNGNEDRAEILEDAENGIIAQPATAASPSIKITDENGNTKIILPCQSVGLALGKYTIEVL